MASRKLPINDVDASSVDDKHDADIKIIWVRWANMEQLITDHNVQFEYHPAVPLSEVDVRKSRENHARIGARLIPENIESMVIQARMHKLLTLPAMVAWQPKGPGTPRVYNDGNNRDVFLRRIGATHAAMYLLINPGPAAAEAITRGANGIVGRGSTEKEMLEHAISYHRDNPGCSYKTAAQAGHVSTGVLIQRLRADALSKRFTVDGDLPVPGSVAFNDTVLCQLAKIQNDTVLQYAATKLLTVPRFPHENADLLQKAIKAARPTTEASQLRAVDDEIARQIAERASESGPQRGPMSVQGRLIRMLRQSLRMVESAFATASPKDVLHNPERRDDFADMSKKLRAALLRVEKGL